jgi:hypothetical protein
VDKKSKDSQTSSILTQKDKKKDRFEENLKNANRELSAVKMKSTFVIGKLCFRPI